MIAKIFAQVSFLTQFLSCLDPLVFLFPKTFKSFGKYFGFECTWWRLFQKCGVHINFDIYVFYWYL